MSYGHTYYTIIGPTLRCCMADKIGNHPLGVPSPLSILELSRSIHIDMASKTQIYRVSQEECARLREGVPYVKVYRYNPKHLCPKLNDYGDNGERTLKL